MPAVSRKQQRYLFMRFGSAWVHAHHFDVVSHKVKGRVKR
jgi:hypothetical protein